MPPLISGFLCNRSSCHRTLQVLTSEELKTQRTESGLTQTRQDKKGALSLGLQIFRIVPWKHFLGDVSFSTGKRMKKKQTLLELKFGILFYVKFGHRYVYLNMYLEYEDDMSKSQAISFFVFLLVFIMQYLLVFCGYIAIILFSSVYYLLFSINTWPFTIYLIIFVFFHALCIICR